jgi:hypothetical protein
MKPEYIFISGVSRTGSTLLLNMLNKSTEMALSPENFFLGHQIPWEGVRYVIKRKVGDLSDDANVYKLVDFLYKGDFNRGTLGYWGWLQKKIDREAFLKKILAAQDRSDRAIFAIMMEVRGEWAQQKKNKVKDYLTLGEKTPSHIYYVPTILEWFPNSRIIHTFRDPRGIFASELRRRKAEPLRFPYKQLHRTGILFTIYVLLQVTYAWLRAAKLHYKYEKLYPDRYFLIRFEELVADPEQSTKSLCKFLEVDYQEAMLEQRVRSRGFKEGKMGFDGKAAYRWQDINPSWINSWFLFWGNKHLQSIGYKISDGSVKDDDFAVLIK